MTRKSSRGVVCLCLAVGFFVATSSSQRPPLNPMGSALLIRAEQTEQTDTSEAKPDLDLKSDKATVCSGTPDFAKGVTTGPSPVIAIPPIDVSGFEKDRRSAVLSLIRYPWQDLGYDIIFMGARPGYRAMTLTAKRRIEIYVRQGEGLMNQAYDLAHELGHAFDLKYNDEARWRKWCELRGIKPSTPWFGCDACPDYRTPAGDFAETFAFLLLGPGNYHSLIAALPKIEQVEELAKFCKIDHLSETLSARLPGKTQTAKAQIPKIEKHAVQENKPENATEPDATPAVDESTPETAATEEKAPEVLSPEGGKPMELGNAIQQESTGNQVPKAEEPATSQQNEVPQPAPSN